MTMHAAQASSPEDPYIAQVLSHLPSAPSLRAQIAMDLRSHIAERLEQGQSIDDVVRQLGDPATLAESYLGAVPLVAATFGDRAIAKVIDFAIVFAGAALVGIGAVNLVALITNQEPPWFFAFPIMAVTGSFGFVIYTIAAEYRTGQTFGKRLRHLRVVRESGARISLGQAIVRQLPALLQILVIDALFALFTDKSQRGFEIISKTRVVRVAPDESADPSA